MIRKYYVSLTSVSTQEECTFRQFVNELLECKEENLDTVLCDLLNATIDCTVLHSPSGLKMFWIEEIYDKGKEQNVINEDIMKLIDIYMTVPDIKKERFILFITNVNKLIS